MKGALFESLQLNMPAMAELLASKGRRGDTMLAHITPKEAKKLKKEGGAGTINPETGLPEFYDGFFSEFDPGSYMAGASYEAPQTSYVPDFSAVSSPSYASTEYTGGGYVPDNYIPSYTAGRPETVPTADYAPAYIAPADFSFGVSGTSPSISDYYTTPATSPVAGLPTTEGLAAGVPSLANIPAALPATTGAVGGAPSEVEPTKPKEAVSITDRLAKALGVSADTLGRLAAGGVQGIMGARQAKQAAAQGQQAKAETKAIAAPYQAKGQELMRAAQAGELTPVNQQALQAAQAKLAQGVETRGGVGAAQMATQVESFRQQLLQQQYDLGLQVSGIGDQINLGAIKTGQEADRYVNTLTNTYFTNIARTVYGGVPGGTERTITIS